MTETTTPPLKTRRWLGRSVLIVSLAANVLLVSFIGVVAYKRSTWRAAMDSPPLVIKIVKKRLPEPDRAVLDQVYRGKEREFVAAQAEYEKALRDTIAILVHPNLDAEALRASVQTARQKKLRVADLTINTFLETITQVSPEARRDLARKFRMW
jgi:uncharacterized membrane protein